MTPLSELDGLFKQWALPFTEDAAAVHGRRMREVEAELRQRLAHDDAELLRWLGTQCPAHGSGAYQVLQRAISRTGAGSGPGAMDACLAFCPITIVLTTTHTTLPKIDVELFRNTRPQTFRDALLAHGFADDCNINVDPLMLPAARVARISLPELPAIVRSMADAAARTKNTDGTQSLGLPHPNEGMADSVSIAGGRVIGTMLIPLLFFSNDLGELPGGLNDERPGATFDAFCTAASQALTTALGRRAPLSIDFIVLPPALIFDALLEGTAAHCQAAAYWATRAAVAAGGTSCTVVYGDRPDRENPQGLSIGFEAGQGVECNVRMFATRQEDVDLYTDAFAIGAHDAGIRMVSTRMHRAATAKVN